MPPALTMRTASISVSSSRASSVRVTQDIDFIDLLSDDEPDEVLPVPSKKRRLSALHEREPSGSSLPGKSVSSQATVPQQLAPSASEGVEGLPVSATIPPAHDGKAQEFQLDPSSFAGMSACQHSELSSGDHLWWLSDFGRPELALCHSSSGCGMVLLTIIQHSQEEPSSICYSTPSRLQLHFFQGQRVTWQQDDIWQQVQSFQIPFPGVLYLYQAQCW